MITFDFLSRFQFFSLPLYLSWCYVGDGDHQLLLYLGRVAEMLRVPSPAPVVGSGVQSVYVDHMALSDHHSLMAPPAEFDGSMQ